VMLVEMMMAVSTLASMAMSLPNAIPETPIAPVSPHVERAELFGETSYMPTRSLNSSNSDSFPSFSDQALIS
jgi:hypothetical protein